MTTTPDLVLDPDDDPADRLDDRTPATTTEPPAAARTTPEVPRWVVPFAIGAIASAALGTWAHVLATTTYLYDQAESSLAVSLVTLAQVGSTSLMMIPAGRMIDRYGPRRALFTGAAGFLCATLVAATTASVGGSTATIGLVASIALLSAGGAAYAPVMQATVPGLVPPARVAGLVTIQFAVVNAAQIVGPPLGTLDFGLDLGPRFLVNLIWFTPIVLLGIVLGRFVVPDRSVPLGKLRDCLAIIRGDRFLSFAYKVAFSVGFLMDPPITLGPAIGESLSDSSSAASTVLTAFAVGSVLGGVRSRRLGAGLGPASQSLFLAAGGYAIAALAPTLWVACIGLFLAGAGFLWLGSALVARVFERIGDGVRGQLMAMWGMSIFSGRIVATLIGGVASDLSSPQVALGLISVFAAAVAAIMLARHRRFVAEGLEG